MPLHRLPTWMLRRAPGRASTTLPQSSQMAPCATDLLTGRQSTAAPAGPSTGGGVGGGAGTTSAPAAMAASCWRAAAGTAGNASLPVPTTPGVSCEARGPWVALLGEAAPPAAGAGPGGGCPKSLGRVLAGRSAGSAAARRWPGRSPAAATHGWGACRQDKQTASPQASQPPARVPLEHIRPPTAQGRGVPQTALRLSRHSGGLRGPSGPGCEASPTRTPRNPPGPMVWGCAAGVHSLRRNRTPPLCPQPLGVPSASCACRLHTAQWRRAAAEQWRLQWSRRSP